MDSETDRTASALRRAVIRLSRRLRAERTGQQVSPLGLAVLGRLHTSGQATPGALAAAEHLQPQSLTRVLAALAEHDLIHRSRDPRDGRQVAIEITPAGAALLLECVADGDRWLSGELARTFTPAEQRLLALAADLLNDHLDGGIQP